MKVGDIVKHVSGNRGEGVVVDTKYSEWSGRTIVRIKYGHLDYNSFYAEDLTVVPKYNWRKL